jgi:hypothetical protein
MQPSFDDYIYRRTATCRTRHCHTRHCERSTIDAMLDSSPFDKAAHRVHDALDVELLAAAWSELSSSTRTLRAPRGRSALRRRWRADAGERCEQDRDRFLVQLIAHEPEIATYIDRGLLAHAGVNRGQRSACGISPRVVGARRTGPWRGDR